MAGLLSSPIEVEHCKTIEEYLLLLPVAYKTRGINFDRGKLN